MYLVIALFTFVVWSIGMVSHNMMGGFIHVFLVLTILIALLRVLTPGRSTYVFKTEHLKNSFRQYTPANVLALTLLAIGLMFMLFGVSEINTVGTSFERTLMLFVAGIVGTSMGFVGLLRAPHSP